jgi:hypothetical protein
MIDYNSVYYHDFKGNLLKSYRISTTILGYENERNSYWNRLNKLNKMVNVYNYSNYKYWKIFDLMCFIISKMKYSFSNKYLHSLAEFSYKIYKKGKSDNYFLRNENCLCFISLYVSLTFKGIIVNVNELIENCSISYNYRKVLIEFFTKFKDIHDKLKNDNFRKFFILKNLFGFVSFEISNDFLNKYWNNLKNFKNNVIISIVLIKCFIPNGKSLNKVHSELGIRLSSGYNSVNRLKKKGIF